MDDSVQPTDSHSPWDVWFSDAFQVTTEGVRSFGRATGCWHTPSPSLGIPPDDTPVPSTLLAAPTLHAVAAVVAQQISSPNMSRILHAGQSYTYIEHPRIGDRVDIGARLVERTHRGGADFFVVETGAYVDGALRITGTSRIVYAGDADDVLTLSDAVVDEVMLAGTGPSAQRAHS
ncbi:hypothetical protein TPAU25S_02875 [Tsukamurella paurometabola]|uniref:FAS1-like dehydratase domain-containing protein n=1 Tax=Tsukamurella paurometabola (strain ATCC 8368 / DSM 20162 / CCUG 35730 / CIP 100753 / JCM 10117 / KCTC 9821 / NBRC 16120 / NCIMB 702349 / NCTC 13040) TaxID=521096 RepID=D5UWV4_TSUPD|nr:hypothetical protein Tpau_1347 [Tsukamurella paurometabola DSM 20162]SUP29607.1 Uncharacterised protein [Tsukamurella paurometabola]